MPFFSLVPSSLCYAKKDDQIQGSEKRAKANYDFNSLHPGGLSDTFSFLSSSGNLTSFRWIFYNGTSSTLQNPEAIYTRADKYNVNLFVNNKSRADNITKAIEIKFNESDASFGLTMSSPEILQITITTNNLSPYTNVTYEWSFPNDTSTEKNRSNSYTEGGTYSVKLTATNEAGVNTLTKQIQISSYEQSYRNLKGLLIDLLHGTAPT